MKRISLILALSLMVLAAYASDTPEDVFWNSVSKSDVIEEYRLYIEQYPKGKYVAEAGRRIGQWEAKQEVGKRPKSVPLIAERYLDNGDGTVTDITTKLQWMRCAMGQTWTGSTCQGTTNRYKIEEARQLRSNFAGYSDWRLPSVKQLLSLVYCTSEKPRLWNDSGEVCDGEYKRPTIEPYSFPNTLTSPFWSETVTNRGRNEVDGVHFWQGYRTTTSASVGEYPVRLVRDSQ